MRTKFKRKCPACGSILEKKQRGYSCPNPECNVMKVYFNRGGSVRRVVREGVEGLKVFSRGHKEEEG